VGCFTKTIIGKPEKWLIEAAASIGLDFSGLIHEVTNYFINHSVKRHGNPGMEKSRGQIAVTSADADRIPDIVKTPDCVIIGIRRNNETFVAYSKRYDNYTVIYYEEVLNSNKNKALRSKTIYKKKGSVSNEIFFKIVANNARTDMSNVKMVGTGGHPGGEA